MKIVQILIDAVLKAFFFKKKYLIERLGVFCVFWVFFSSMKREDLSSHSSVWQPFGNIAEWPTVPMHVQP